MNRADEMQPRDANEAAVLGFFTTLMRRDLPAFERLWTEDGVQEHVFRFEGLTPALRGRDQIMDDYRRMFRNRSGHVFTIHALYRTTDLDCIIVEARGVSVVGETGNVYDQRYVMVFQLRGGLIALNRFYCNPLLAKAAFEGVLIGQGISPQENTLSAD